MRFFSIMCIASAARCPAGSVLTLADMSVVMATEFISGCSSNALRKSPSVKMPFSWPFSPTMVIPKPLAVISIRASAKVAVGATKGISVPLIMRSSTRSSSRFPNAPPGWENAKSSSVKPRLSSSAMAKASPIAKAAVVLDVGARSRGQASVSTPAST